MARSPRKPTLTSSTNPQLERQARRISRQQKQLAKELAMEAAPVQVKLTGASNRSISIKNLKRISPMNDMQERFFDIYEDGNILTFMLGSPGVGKTFLSLFKAIEDVMEDGKFRELIIVRSTEQVKNVGFLKGTLEEKEEIFKLPYKEIFSDLFGRKDAYDKLVEQGYVRFISTTAIRGITLDNAIIVIDEATNCTWSELSAIISRAGKQSKVIVCGDKFQNDLKKNKNEQSGLSQFIEVCEDMNEAEFIYFTPEHIIRSGLVKSFILACDRKGYLMT